MEFIVRERLKHIAKFSIAIQIHPQLIKENFDLQTETHDGNYCIHIVSLAMTIIIIIIIITLVIRTHCFVLVIAVEETNTVDRNQTHCIGRK
jgi:hypothetical protein